MGIVKELSEAERARIEGLETIRARIKRLRDENVSYGKMAKLWGANRSTLWYIYNRELGVSNAMAEKILRGMGEK